MIKNWLLKKIIFKNRLSLIEQKNNLYNSINDRESIEKFQIRQFNKIWENAYKNIPFYIKWKSKYNLPNKISKIEELKHFPILTKKDIQKNQKLIFDNLKNYSIISTGGSTGEPTKFPVSTKESNINYANNYMAKGWWGLEPLDNILLFWGHSHLFGSGIKGQINQYKRVLSDWLINTKRLNAYDMSIDTLSKYYQYYKKYNPEFIIGYTSSIYKLAKYIKENNLVFKEKRKLKGVIVTSETVTQYDIHLIEEVFKVPCIVEYGMAETGVIAYSKDKTDNIKLFWDSFIGLKDKDDVLNITTITNKAFPLINYKTDDIIDSDDEISILTMNGIKGRKNDFLVLYIDNKYIEVHSEFFTHILKSIKGVVNFQLIQKKDKSIKILYVSLNDIDNIKDMFYNEVKKEFSNIDENQFSFKKVIDIPKTIAGKSKWIIKE